MSNLADVKLGGTGKYILKGRPGTAKSCAALTFPKPMYIFDLDGRIKSLVKWCGEMGYADLLAGVEFDYYSPRDFAKFKSRIDAFEIHCKYKTVVLDSLTAAGDIMIAYANAIKGTGNKVGEIKIPGFEEYGAEYAGLTSSMEILRSLPSTIAVVTAHVVETSQKKPDGTFVSYQRLLTAGKPVAAKLPIYFNHIFHFDVETSINVGGKNKYVVYPDHAGDDWARTEYPLTEKIDITGKKFYDVLRDLLKKKEIDI